METSIKEITKSLRLRYQETEEDVCLIDDQEDGTMRTYDMDGILIGVRPLRPAEKQMSIASKVS